MIKYRKNSFWGFNRQFKKSPHKALLDLEVTSKEAVYFKLKGQTFLFCHFEQLHEQNILDATYHQPLSLKDSQQISSFKLFDNSLILALMSFSKCPPLKSKNGKKKTFSIPFCFIVFRQFSISG